MISLHLKDRPPPISIRPEISPENSLFPRSWNCGRIEEIEWQIEISRRYIMGLFSKKKNEEVAIDELTPQIKTKLDELAQKGNQFEEEEQYEEAIQAWKEALSLIPEPQQFYSETIWFLAAIGDIYFQKKQYEKAHECFDKARGNLSGEGYGNPFVMLRLGECCLEIGDEKNATEYLLRAYMFEGREIFEPDEDGNDDGKKYFDYLRTHVENIE